MSRTVAWMLALGALIGWSGEGQDPAGAPEAPLRSAAEFASIADEVERSKALLVEAGRVLQHPRCLNCHPSDGHPRQGEAFALHQPPVVRGVDNHGVPAMRCGTCHQARNVEHAGLPGHPAWHLAPLEMGWIGLSLEDICEQIKDVERNGGMDLESLHEHMARDSLVGWAWEPGPGLEPAPGTQASFGELIRAWIDSGAHCPDGAAGATVVEVETDGSECSNCHDRSFGVAAN